MPGAIIRTTCLTAVLAGVLSCTAAASAEHRDLRRIVYDYAVTSYCLLLTPEVEAGFQLELATATDRSGLSPDEAKAQRIAGWVDADREWSNRGLGGFRAWCGDEGVSAARHFLAVARGTAAP
jgi:hypothetical protein